MYNNGDLMLKNKILLALSFVSVLFGNEVIFQAMALQDLNTMHQTILENHPGPYNQKDPDFMKNMDQAYRQAKNSVVDIYTEQEAFDLLDTFAKSFCDQHLCVYSVKKQNTTQVFRLPQPFLINYFTDDIVWVTIPNFEPTKFEQEQLELLIEQLSNLRTKKYIIFDVRGNGGGSTLWGTRILQALFTKEYVSQKFAQTYVDCYEDFRVSKSNLEFWNNVTPWFESSFGKNSKEYQEWQQLLQGMQKAYDDQQIFYSMKVMIQEPEVLQQAVQSPVKAKIVVFIDSGCFSSCLGFIHELQVVDETITLMGEKTAINTSYMEIREDVLPSGIHFRYPTAVGRNSKPHFHFYIPDIAYPEDIKDQDSIQKWLEETIKSLN